MAEPQHSASEVKHMSLDKIIEAMTADLESSTGHYAQFGVNSQQTQVHNWVEYTPSQVQHYMTSTPPHTSPQNLQLINQIPAPVYMQPELSNYEAQSADPIYFPPQTVNHLEINENNDLVGTIDVGGGNYINVIYGNASQIMAEQCQQLNTLGPYNNQSLIDREYGLFSNKQISMSQSISNQGQNGKQFIENLVGNWVPNQSGTYSPFGESPNVTPDPQNPPEVKEHEEIQRTNVEVQQKKPRMIAEVKPMRPSYSDVLTKSVPTPMSPMLAPLKPKIEGATKKVVNKNSKNKSKPTVLKRQNSSGSDDHCSPKIQVPKKSTEKNKANLPRRWVSLDNLGSPNDSSELNDFHRTEKFDTKKKAKQPIRKGEKNETLNNMKTQNANNKNNSNNTQKRQNQINNNLNTVIIFNQTSDKLETNQQINNNNNNNKVNKEEKKVVKEKGFKRFQTEKSQQTRKGQRNRKRDNREVMIKNFYKTVSKHTTRWSRIALKIFYWLIHLISDVISMSINLVFQLGKCGWFHTILYTKYSWVYIVNTVSKVRFLNAVGRRMDSWFGNSRFAFWRKLKSKTEEKDEKDNTNWIHGGLESNIALPSTGEEAMKRLLACKGKDPYSILGVTSTCSDDDIKKYYKRQAFLVHPDKNSQPGAEEAFKILVHAFDIIGEPERRQAFDQTRQVEAAWGELSDLLSQLHRKMEQAANTIRCTNCGLRHKRVPTQRPCYAARFCAQCKIRHSAKEGDIWAESRVMGFLWHYYACMEGAVYDVTDWAACQAGNLKHLRANTHSVQYRIVLGQRPPSQTSNNGKKKQQMDPNTSEEDFEDFINNLYNEVTKRGSSTTSGDQNTFKGDTRRRKAKRKK